MTIRHFNPADVPLRVGQGTDVHILEEGLPLILGGVKIDHSKGLKGHSDADALLHAITDAILGAAGLGDIGRHFPDSDPAYKGADSCELLRKAYQKIKVHNWTLVNIDATIHAEYPKIKPYAEQMVNNIAEYLEMEPEQVNIKGKTNEKVGFIGREEGVAVTCVAMICRIIPDEHINT